MSSRPAGSLGTRKKYAYRSQQDRMQCQLKIERHANSDLHLIF